MLWFFRTAFIICVTIILVFGTHPAPVTAPSGDELSAAKKKKKILEWGWDAPTTAFLKENINKVERMPFDGVVFPLRLRDGTDVSWKMWGPTRFDYSGLAYIAEDLTQTQFKSLTDRFVRVNVTPGNVDWFDNQAWSTVLQNFSLAAKVAKAGNCKGFMFDTEEYESKPFSLTFSTAVHSATPQEYHAIVRQRGREWIGAVSQAFPNIVILFPWAYLAYEFNKQDYPLLPDFLDGIFEAAPPAVRLVDAGEGAYEAKTQRDFQWLHWKIKQDMRRYSAVPELYKARVEAGFGIWLDAQRNKNGWHQDDLNKKFFNPSGFKKSVTYALETSDEYVWIYSEKPNWWTGVNLPPAYAEAVRSAKERN